MQTDDKLNTYKVMIEEMSSSVEKAIGSHVFQIILEHIGKQNKNMKKHL